MKIIMLDAQYENVLDFGCGSGVLLPFLAKHSLHVSGMDINLQPYEWMKAHISFPNNIQMVDGNQFSLQQYPSESFDLIIALDVLEHVPNLSATINQLMHILKPGKKLIVSGPSENILYQIGRRIAGKEYSGEYHERGVADIIRSARQKGKVETLSIIFQPMPLFYVFSLEKPLKS